jgi:hypothetical protein
MEIGEAVFEVPAVGEEVQVGAAIRLRRHFG